MSKFEIRDDEHGIGKVLILKDEWEDSIADYMIKNQIYALRLTDSYGFKGKDLSFIPALTFLKSFEIYCWDAKDINVIEALTNLEVLSVQFMSNKVIEVSSFSKLRVVMLTWKKGLTSLLSPNSIEHLNISNYPYENLLPISHLSNLKKLYLTSKKLKTLEGIENFGKLEHLDLYNCQQLISKAGINKCMSLQKVEIEACNKLSA
ncbi:MAG: hypothetical protein KUG82_20425 [Pseudomonadales bacterium]|nr:hypothetical protein [Pseudomonadales bacterium]